MLWSLSLRSEVMDTVTELSRMPRNVKDVAGPSVFSGWMGMLMEEHA